MKPIPTLLFWGCIATQALSLELPSLPKDVPPVVGMARVIAPESRSDAGTLEISLTVPKIQWRVVGEVVPKKEWPELGAEVELEVLTLQLDGPFALAPTRIVDLAGGELKPEEWQKRLAAEKPVLVSVSGRMPDPYFLQVVQPDTLIFILGPRDGAPAPRFLAREQEDAEKKGDGPQKTLSGVVLRKEWTKSYESWNAGGSEYYVLKVEGDDLPEGKRTAREGVILRPSKAVPFDQFEKFVGRKVTCRGKFVAGERYVPDVGAVEQAPSLPDLPGGQPAFEVRGSGFQVEAIE